MCEIWFSRKQFEKDLRRLDRMLPNKEEFEEDARKHAEVKMGKASEKTKSAVGPRDYLQLMKDIAKVLGIDGRHIVRIELDLEINKRPIMKITEMPPALWREDNGRQEELPEAQSQATEPLRAEDT